MRRKSPRSRKLGKIALAGFPNSGIGRGSVDAIPDRISLSLRGFSSSSVVISANEPPPPFPCYHRTSCRRAVCCRRRRRCFLPLLLLLTLFLTFLLLFSYPSLLSLSSPDLQVLSGGSRRCRSSANAVDGRGILRGTRGESECPGVASIPSSASLSLPGSPTVTVGDADKEFVGLRRSFGASSLQGEVKKNMHWCIGGCAAGLE